MDYSLLLVIEERASGDFSTEQECDQKQFLNKILSQDKQLIYHIGVIDYLQDWNFVKRVENIYKTKLLQRDAYQIAAIKPKNYARRWIDFMKTYVFLANERDSHQSLVRSVFRSPSKISD